MSIEKIMNGTDKNIISGIGENDEVFFFFLSTSYLSFSLSFYLIGKPQSTHSFNLFVSFQKKNNSHFHSRQSTFK
jgi:hypothetical protein